MSLREKLGVDIRAACSRRSRRVSAAFVDALEGESRAEIEVRPPRFEPIFGAVLLGAEAAGWRLAIEAMEMRHGV